MLSLDKVKTITIYSKHELQEFYQQFRSKLTQAYEKQTNIAIRDVLIMLKLLYLLLDVPQFAKQFHNTGDIQATASLQILYAKCTTWLSIQRQQTKDWSALLIKSFENCIPGYKKKDNIVVRDVKQLNPIQFFNENFNIWSSTDRASVNILVSLLRIYIVNQLQFKQKIYKFSNNNQLNSQWKNLLHNLIAACRVMQTIKKQQICISIIYLLCSQQKKFIKQCLQSELITFLLISLNKKNLTERYVKKIFNFLKLLLLQDDKKNSLSVSQFQICLSQFAENTESKQIWRYMLELMRIVERKNPMIDSIDYIENIKQKKLRYDADFNQQNRNKLITAIEIAHLYISGEKMHSNINKTENLEFIMNFIEKQHNFMIIKPLLRFIIHYIINTTKQQTTIQLSQASIAKLSQIFQQQSVQLTKNNKQYLVYLSILLKKILQKHDINEHTIPLAKKYQIQDRLHKYSDGMIFNFQRVFYQIKVILHRLGAGSKPNIKNILLALTQEMLRENHMKGSLEAELQQIKLLLSIIQSNPTQISQQIAQILPKKLHDNYEEDSTVSIKILNNSQNQQIKYLKNRINQNAILCIVGLYKQKKYAKYFENDMVLEKIMKIGQNTTDKQTLIAVGKFLQMFLNRNTVKSIWNDILRKNGYNLVDAGLEIGQQILSKIDKKTNNSQQIVQKLLSKCQQNIESPQQQQKIALSVISTLNTQQIKEILSTVLRIFNKNKQSISILRILLKIIEKIARNYPELIKSILLKQLKKYYLEAQHHHQDIYNMLYVIFWCVFQICEKQYFGEILQKSYMHVTAQSIQFTQQCFENLLLYKPTEGRKQNYMKFCQNNLQYIGRQAAMILQANQDINFWDQYKQHLLQCNKFHEKYPLLFQLAYFSKCPQKIWQQFQLIQFISDNIENLRKFQQFETMKTRSEIKILKSIIKVILVANKNKFLDTKKVHFLQNSVILQFVPEICAKIVQKLQFQAQYLLMLIDLLEILICTYQAHESNKVMLSNANNISKLQQLVLAAIEINNKSVNDKILEILRIILLKDNQKIMWKFIEKFISISSQRLSGNCTDKGQVHLLAIKRIMKMLETNDSEGLKKQNIQYFYGLQGNNGMSITNLTLSNEQLLRYLKKLLQPPYIHGLNTLLPKIHKIQSEDYANTLLKVFLASEQLYLQDPVKPKLTLQQTQKIVVEAISGKHVDLIPQFYDVLSMNKIGLSLSVQKKNIGVRGVSIVCQQMSKDPQDALFYADILTKVTNTEKQFQIQYDHAIYEYVNKTYPEKYEQKQYVIVLGNLIGSSSKYKKIQQKYSIIEHLLRNLQVFRHDLQPLSSTLYALSGLVYQHPGNQAILGRQINLALLMQIVQQNHTNYEVISRAINLLSNLIYKNHAQKSKFINLNIPQKILAILSSYLQKQRYPYNVVKQLIKLIGNLSLHFEIAQIFAMNKIMTILKKLIEKAHEAFDEDLVKYSFDVMFNLVNSTEKQVKSIVTKLYQQGYLESIFMAFNKYTINTEIIEACFDSYECVCHYDIIANQSIKREIFQSLIQIQKYQEWKPIIMNKWIYILYRLTMKDQYLAKMLDTVVLAAVCNYLKLHDNLKLKTIQMLLDMILRIQKLSLEANYQYSGFTDLVIQILRIENLPSTEIQHLLSILIGLHQKQLLSKSHYSQLFQTLINRLQLEYRDENARKILNFIKKIKQKVTITTSSAIVLLELSFYILTQTQAITSPKYHCRVRQLISLLAYFSAFHMELRLILRQQTFFSILKNWIKIDSLLQQSNSITQSCRMCLLSILNDQKFLVTLNDQISLQEIRQKLSKGYDCLLYRLDKSNKNAIIKIQDNQLVSFKAPNGQIKEKYRVPFQSIILLRHTYIENDEIFRQSNFYQSGGIFKKDPVTELCVTIFGLVGEELSIRELNIEFLDKQSKIQFVQYLKIVITSYFRQNNMY